MKIACLILLICISNTFCEEVIIAPERMGMVKKSYDEETREAIVSALGDLKKYEFLIICTDPFRQVIAISKIQKNDKLHLNSIFWTPQLANSGPVKTEHDENGTKDILLMLSKLTKAAKDTNIKLHPFDAKDTSKIEYFYMFEKFANGTTDDWQCYRVQSFPENKVLIKLMNNLIPKEMNPSQKEIDKFFEQ